MRATLAARLAPVTGGDVDASCDTLLMTPVAPHVIDGPLRRIARQNTRANIGRYALGLLILAPGVFAAHWLTQGWNWPEATMVVAGVLCLTLALLLRTVRGIVRRLVAGPAPPDATPDTPIRATLVRDDVGGGATVVSPPPGSIRAEVGAAIIAFAFLPLAASLDSDGGHRSTAALAAAVIAGLGVAVLAAGFAWPPARLKTPRLMLFADRIELREGRGRYVIAWPDIIAAAVHRERAVIYVRASQAVTLKGRVPPLRKDQLQVEDPVLGPSALVGAIEHYRTDEAARRDIARPPRPRVLDGPDL